MASRLHQQQRYLGYHFHRQIVRHIDRGIRTCFRRERGPDANAWLREASRVGRSPRVSEGQDSYYELCGGRHQCTRHQGSKVSGT
eukprot:scaffold284397_cov26-Tisochrysis_lutea.AAC.3